jgi:hypothetical protein
MQISFIQNMSILKDIWPYLYCFLFLDKWALTWEWRCESRKASMLRKMIKSPHSSDKCFVNVTLVFMRCSWPSQLGSKIFGKIEFVVNMCRLFF